MMLDLAVHRSDGFIALKDIADRQNISKKYLEQIVPLLNKADLLRTNRGYQGGYALSKNPDQYTVGEILRVTEGSLCPVSCLQYPVNECPRASECITLPVWEGLYKAINNYLDSVTLQDIIDNSTGGGHTILDQETYVERYPEKDNGAEKGKGRLYFSALLPDPRHSRSG